MKPSIRIVWISLLVGGMARGQIQEDLATCIHSWGTPVAGGVDVVGCGVVEFQWKRLLITCEFLSGRVQNCTFRGDSMTPGRVNQLLNLNGSDEEWMAEINPDQKTGTDNARRWIRADKEVQAEFVPGEMRVRVVSPPWSRSDDARAPLTAAMKPPEHVSSSPKPLVPETLIGWWENRAEGVLFDAMNVRRDGTVTWRIVENEKPRDVAGHWTFSRYEGKPAYCFYMKSSASSAKFPDHQVGYGWLRADDHFRFHVSRNSASQFVGFADAAADRIVDFHPVASRRRWRPAAPDNLPRKGDSKASVLRELGMPGGRMVSGGREALVYAWGTVWIDQGLVIEVE